MDRSAVKKIWMVVGAGCGTILILLVGVVMIGRRKVEEAGGPRAFAAHLMAAGLDKGLAPKVLTALPPGEQNGAREAFAELQKKTRFFQDQDLKELGEAMERYRKAADQNPVDPEAARRLVQDCRAIAARY